MRVWASLKRFLVGESGFTALQYLILALLLGSIAFAAAAALTTTVAATHNSMVNNVTAITGSGF